jgi:ribosomal protein L37AE/L43A
MLVRCNIGCKKSNGQTDASLDVESDMIICNTCGENVDGLSDFCKLSMKANGDIIRHKARKAFTFPCNTCDKHVEARFVDGILVGKPCQNNGSGCQINVTEAMLSAIKSTETPDEL